MPSPFHLYSTLWESLTGQLLGPSRAAAKLEEKFGTSSYDNHISQFSNDDIENDDNDNVDMDLENNELYVSKQHGRSRSTGSSKRHHETAIVVLVDEIDLLVTSQQTVLYSLFDWPSRASNNIIVIGIANTMDLPERMLPRVVSRLSSFGGLQRVTFAPYTQVQLQKIIKSRLTNLEDPNQRTKNFEGQNTMTKTNGENISAAFDTKSLEYASRKVAAISGDVRRALELCRRSVEMTIARGGKQQVTISDVNNAVRELSFSPHIAIITNSPFHQRVFLAACVMEMRFSGISTLKFVNVANRHIDMCRNHGHFDRNNGNTTKDDRSTSNPPLRVPQHPSISVNFLPTMSQLSAIVSHLASNRLIVVEHFGNHNMQRIQLNIAVEDVTYALKNDQVTWLKTFLA